MQSWKDRCKELAYLAQTVAKSNQFYYIVYVVYSQHFHHHIKTQLPGTARWDLASLTMNGHYIRNDAIQGMTSLWITQPPMKPNHTILCGAAFGK